MEKLKLDIQGMSCGHCVNHVTQALKGMNGVTVNQVEIGSATVQYDPSVTDQDSVAHAVSDAGYEATATPA